MAWRTPQKRGRGRVTDILLNEVCHFFRLVHKAARLSGAFLDTISWGTRLLSRGGELRWRENTTHAPLCYGISKSKVERRWKELSLHTVNCDSVQRDLALNGFLMVLFFVNYFKVRQNAFTENVSHLQVFAQVALHCPDSGRAILVVHFVHSTSRKNCSQRCVLHAWFKSALDEGKLSDGVCVGVDDRSNTVSVGCEQPSIKGRSSVQSKTGPFEHHRSFKHLVFSAATLHFSSQNKIK